MLEVPPNHGPERHDHSDKSERFAESRLYGFEHSLRSHSACQAQCHTRDEQRQEGMHFGRKDQRQQEHNRRQGERDEIRAMHQH